MAAYTVKQMYILIVLFYSIVLYGSNIACTTNNQCWRSDISCLDYEDCTITCAASNACSKAQITCPIGAKCSIICDDIEDDCLEIVVHANQSTLLAINCLDNPSPVGQTDSCRQQTIYCPTQPGNQGCIVHGLDSDNQNGNTNIYAIQGLNDLEITGSNPSEITIHCTEDFSKSCTITKTYPFDTCNTGNDTCLTYTTTALPTPFTANPTISPTVESSHPSNAPTDNPSNAPTNLSNAPTLKPTLKILPTHKPTHLYERMLTEGTSAGARSSDSNDAIGSDMETLIIIVVVFVIMFVCIILCSVMYHKKQLIKKSIQTETVECGDITTKNTGNGSTDFLKDTSDKMDKVCTTMTKVDSVTFTDGNIPFGEELQINDKTGETEYGENRDAFDDMYDKVASPMTPKPPNTLRKGSDNVGTNDGNDETQS